jgi:acyl-CoA reductase-like NAD-dependent aldehyde dehydrogenase
MPDTLRSGSSIDSRSALVGGTQLAKHSANFSMQTQEQVDRVGQAMADAAFKAAERLGKLAQEETGYGVALHKRVKNEFASKMVWDSIKNVKTVGVIRRDEQRGSCTSPGRLAWWLH